MKQLLIALFAVVVGAGLTMNDADAAKRFGGGSSSGMQRSQPLKRDAAPNQNTAPNSPAAPQQSGASRWLGPLAGLAAGIGIAALFSHFGLGEEFSSVIMMMLIAAAVVFVFRLLMRRMQPQTQPLRYAGGPVGTAPYEPVTGASSAPVSGGSRMSGPADFDAESFLHNAKLNFLRLQAANDAGDIEDIRTFTTPEMFAVVKLQMQERGTESQKTDVVKLDAELLEVTTEFRQHIASVRFSGTIRETAGAAAPDAFCEIWHITKPIDDSRNWAIAGIQQVS